MIGIFILLFIFIDFPLMVSARRERIVLNANNPSQEFTSPRYPRRHPARALNQWRIIAPLGSSITLRCSDLNIARTNNCRRIRLIIEGRRICGQRNIRETFSKSKLRVMFRSKLRVNRNSQGFTCTASYTDTSSQQPISQSPADPLSSDAPPTDIPPTEPQPDVPPVSTPSDPQTPVSTTLDPRNVNCQCGIKTSSRIIGGQETDINEYPWQGRLGIRKGQFYYLCSGTLISPEWLVSAAHCTQDPDSIRVILGDHSINTNEQQSQTIEVIQIINHPDYSKNRIDNDISLLKLSSPVTYNQAISSICLPFNYETFEISGEIGTVTGWGKTSSGSTSNVLMEVEVLLSSTEKCRTESNYGYRITDNMICAGADGKDSCHGDSGGPLVWENDNLNNFLLGIVSWGNECAQEGYPGVYTKVTNYLTWIKDETGASDSFCVIDIAS
ncbi:UNVERIFIED_CONTAM: hypothetical protein GTU68_042330 [Idotea baltica]|nr:hypothetical protein [Idotea baltica]